MSNSLQTTQYPDWWYRNRRPASDDAYFENLYRIIFQAGLNWQVVAKKGATIKEAFCDCKVNKVACFNEAT